MKIKRFLSLFTVLTMIMGMVSLTSFAEGGTKLEGKCGENAEWFINSDATLVISGDGSVESKSKPWNLYSNDIQRIVIEHGIVSFSNANCFSSCKNLKEAVFSSTVTNLYSCLSSSMVELNDVWIYAKDMGNSFKYSSAVYPKAGSGTKWHVYQNTTTEKSLRDGLSLTDDDIEYITEDQKFPVIENRTPVELHEVTETSGPCGLTTIYEWNESSKTLTFSGKGVLSMPDYYYEKYKGAAEHILIKSGITLIDAMTSTVIDGHSCGAFYDFTELKDVELPDTLTEIGDGSFNSCPSLTILVNGLPKNLETIGYSAFYNTSLSGDLILPETLNQIGEYAFHKTNITSVNLHEGMAIFGSAFRQCNSLEEVTIPKNLKFRCTQTSNAMRDSCAFEGCESLEKVIIKGESTYAGMTQSFGAIENAIADGIFHNCTSLNEIIIEAKNIEYLRANGSECPTFDMTNNPKFYIYKDSTTEQTLKDAGYLTDDNTVYIADFSKLETAISDAEAVETDKYTDESVSAFNEALEAGKAILEDKTSTQDEIDKAVKAIEDAKNALTDKSDEPSNPSDSSSDPSDSSKNPSDSSNPSGSGQSESSNSGSSQPTSAQPATNAPTTAAPKVTPPTATKVVKPAKVKSVKLKAKKKKLKVSWKKVSGATGYEVKAARNRKFTKGKKTVTVKKNKVTIKNLKPKKKYFVKVRAYKLANGRKYYGKWSKVVKKKVK